VIGLLAAAVLSAAAPTNVEVRKRFSPEYRRCAPVASDDLSRFHCIKGELERQNLAIARALQARTQRLPAARKRLFVKQQYSWLAARNEQCVREARSGPSPVFAEELKCRLFETIRHTIALERGD
jgi:uncharacterized protein YecT (DUF1311 family)